METLGMFLMVLGGFIMGFSFAAMLFDRKARK